MAAAGAVAGSPSRAAPSSPWRSGGSRSSKSVSRCPGRCLGAQAGQGSFDRLGALVLASSIASFLNSWVWGRLAVRSSRSVLMFSGLAGAAALLMAVALDWAGFSGTIWALPLVLFVLMIAYHGVRPGRVIYLVDMAPDDNRAANTTVSNTVIGVLLLGSGIFGALASLAGAQVTLVAVGSARPEPARSAPPARGST